MLKIGKITPFVQKKFHVKLVVKKILKDQILVCSNVLLSRPKVTQSSRYNPDILIHPRVIEGDRDWKC